MYWNRRANRKSLFSKNAGKPPGALIEPEKGKQSSEIEVIRYDKNTQSREILRMEDIEQLKPGSKDVLWINIIGTGDSQLLKFLESKFNLSSLTLEMIQNIDQRPVINDFGHYIHLILKMITWNNETGTIASEQVSLILGKGIIISIQEKAGDLFDPVRDRIENGRGRIRSNGADYLFYALIDSVVDNLFILCDAMQEKEEILEERSEEERTSDTIEEIAHLKRQLISLRRAVWPLRELLSMVQKGEFSLIAKSNMKYFRDLLDHTLIVIDIIENLREILTSLHESRITSLSIEMNNVMKVLTIIATIFIPLTFIAGIYGMNFAYMPELNWRWGYFTVWGIMIVLFVAMIAFFKKKKWF